MADETEAPRGIPGSDLDGQIYQWLRRALFLAVAAAALYRLWPFVLDVLSSAPRLATIERRWLVVMIVVEAISFVCVWWLIRLVLPTVSWFVAGTSQIVSNAVSRTIPGAAAAGGATMYRMLSVSGVAPTEAAGALAATSILSTAAVFAIPTIALGMAILGAPIPEDLEPVAAAGAVLFFVLLAVGFVAHRFDAPIRAVGRVLDRAARRLPHRWRREIDPQRLIDERDRLVSVLGDTWGRALAAVAGNWAFDYLTLVAALYAVGAQPRLSLVLLAYAGAVVTSMIPLTPGGFGFVEATLVWLLVLSGISTQNAALATLAYRIVSLLLPVCAALPAWFAYRRRFRPAGSGGTAGSGDTAGSGGTAGSGLVDSDGEAASPARSGRETPDRAHSRR